MPFRNCSLRIRALEKHFFFGGNKIEKRQWTHRFKKEENLDRGATILKNSYSRVFNKFMKKTFEKETTNFILNRILQKYNKIVG